MISVIVPVYNAEKYIDRCIQSILAQTYSDIELILVDDGSADSSPLQCDAFEKADSRVRVIHKPNGGAASARNAGLDAALGDYIAFCDCDDMVSPHWLERLADTASENVLSVCSYCGNAEQLDKFIDSAITPGKEFSRSHYAAFNNAGLAGYLCNALYCTSVIRNNHIRLRERREEGDYNEDLLFALNYVSHIDRIVFTGYSDYFYDTREDSLSRGRRDIYFDKYAEKYRLWKAFVEKECERPDTELATLSDKMLYHFLTVLHESIGDYRKFKRIALSDEVCDCIIHSEGDKENPFEIDCLKKGRTFRLYWYLKLHKLKRRIVK